MGGLATEIIRELRKKLNVYRILAAAEAAAIAALLAALRSK